MPEGRGDMESIGRIAAVFAFRRALSSNYVNAHHERHLVDEPPPRLCFSSLRRPRRGTVSRGWSAA